MKIDDGGAAFPTYVLTESGGMLQDGPGMSVRDFFAGAVAHGMIANNACMDAIHDATADANAGRLLFAKEAYAHADAMLAARKETP